MAGQLLYKSSSSDVSLPDVEMAAIFVLPIGFNWVIWRLVSLTLVDEYHKTGFKLAISELGSLGQELSTRGSGISNF